jgi:hypothetical protein
VICAANGQLPPNAKHWMEAVTRSNPFGAKSSNGTLPKAPPVKCYSANDAPDKILITGRHSENLYLFVSTRKSNPENTKLKSTKNFLLFFWDFIFSFL